MSAHLHEFSPGGRHVAEIEEDDCCFYCGKCEAQWHHLDDHGVPWRDPNNFIDRIRYDGTLSPRFDGETAEEKLREERVERERQGHAGGGPARTDGDGAT